jgi:hypothetical protein
MIEICDLCGTMRQNKQEMKRHKFMIHEVVEEYYTT